MNILITGSSGFIGRHLINYLISLGKSSNELFILDRTGNLNNTKNQKNISYIKLADLNKSIVKIDIIIHLAGKAHITSFTKDDAKEISLLTNQLLSFSIINNTSKFIFLSTIKVYGKFNHLNENLIETHQVNPLCLYSKSKYEIEKKIINFYNTHNIKYFIFRIPLVIGEGAKGNLNTLMKYLSKNIPLPFGSINNHRSVISITNLLHCLNNVLIMNNLQSGIFNICDTDKISTSDLINLMKKNLGSRSIIFNLNNKIINFILYIFGRSDDYSKLFLSHSMDNKKSINNGIYRDKVKTSIEIKRMVDNFLTKHE